jgi:hypothetical protein
MYAIAWEKFQNDYYLEYFEIINYLKNIWIIIFVKKIMKFHTNKIRHFFIIFTSRFENAHRVLKQHLRFFIENLKMIIDNIEILLMNQRRKYAMKLDIVKMKISFDLRISLFRDLIFHVISHALRLVHKQFLLLQSDDINSSMSCTNAWIKISELLCVHTIKKRMTSS